MITAGEIYGSALRILRAASHYPTFRPIYEDTRESARGLADNGYLEPIGADEYQITEKGLVYLSLAPDAKPRSPKINDMPRPPRGRRITQKPQPQGVHKVLHPKRFGALSTRQQDTLRFVARFTKEMGFPPTYREIGESVGIPSVSVVGYNIERLMQAGWLERTDGVSRGLRLIQELPGSKTQHDMQVTNGVLRIAVNLHGKPQTVVEAAQAAIERLQEVLATAQAEGHGA